MRPNDRDSTSATLHDYLRVLRRRRWIVLLPLVLLPALAFFFSLRQQPLYQASAEVLLSRQNLATSLTGTIDPTQYQQADRIAQTQAGLARVPELAQRVLRVAGMPGRSAQDFLGSSSVTAQQNEDLLHFSVRDRHAPVAERLATVYADEFARYKQELDGAAIKRARAEVDQRIAALETAHDTKTPLYSALVDKSETLATMEALQTSSAVPIHRPDRADQVAPRPVRNTILGAALGLLLGLGLAFLWESLDTRLRTADEIESLVGAPLLARLPEPARKLRTRYRLLMLETAASPLGEAFRVLRVNLNFLRLDREVRTIMVTSALAEEGKSTTVANLAVTLARSGERVILVDLDLRRPTLHKFFDLEQEDGLTQVALGELTLDQALAQIPLAELPERPKRRRRSAASANGASAKTVDPVGTLDVLPAGPIPPNPGEFVASHVLAGLLNDLGKRADVILIDTPPALQVGDAIVLSEQIDAVVLVTRLGVARRPQMNELRRLLDPSPARLLGFVLTNASQQAAYGDVGDYHPAQPAAQPREAV